MVVHLSRIAWTVNTPLVMVTATILGLTIPGSAAQAQCGGNDERPCQVLERIPSCNKGLVEDFAKNKCVKPAAPAKKTDLACGAENQRPCQILERVPSCNNRLVEDFSKNKCVKAADLACGALDQRPCMIVERFPSCNKDLAEDFINGKCVKSNRDAIQQILRGIPSTAFFKKPGNHQTARMAAPRNAAESRAVSGEMDSRVPQAVRTAATTSAKENGVITMVGVDCRSGIIVFVGRECTGLGEINFPDGRKGQYIMNLATAGVQAGVAADVVWTTIKAETPLLNWRGEVSVYDYYVGGVSIHPVVGGTFQLVFDKDWNVIGTRGGVGVGAEIGLFFGAVGLRN